MKWITNQLVCDDGGARRARLARISSLVSKQSGVSPKDHAAKNQGFHKAPEIKPA